MRKPILLSFALLLVICSANRGGEAGKKPLGPLPKPVATNPKCEGWSGSPALPSDPVAQELLIIAACNNLLKVRAGALDNVSKLKLDPKTVPFLIWLLDNRPGLPDYEKDFFALHVVQALGAIGPEAKEALPDLVKATGKDAILDKAIEAAEQSILQPKAGTKPVKDDIADLVKTLQDKKKEVSERLVAARKLGDLANKTNLALILPPLVKAMKEDSESLVRRVAAESRQNGQISLDSLNTPKTPEYIQWTKDFVDGLASMLAKKDADPYERIFAALALGKLAETIRTDQAFGGIPIALNDAAMSDSNADVQCVAKNALNKFSKKKEKK